MTNNNYLPTDRCDTRFYVYLHIDPDCEVVYPNPIVRNKVVYVGMGQGARAWTFGNYRSQGAYGHRSEDHWNWYLEKELAYSIEDLVIVYSNRMSKKEALTHEKAVIEEFSPEFNLPLGKGLLKISPEDFKLCQELRKNGLYYNQIANEIGVSTMTVYRALNNQTKNIGDDYGK